MGLAIAGTTNHLLRHHASSTRRYEREPSRPRGWLAAHTRVWVRCCGLPIVVAFEREPSRPCQRRGWLAAHTRERFFWVGPPGHPEGPLWACPRGRVAPSPPRGAALASLRLSVEPAGSREHHMPALPVKGTDGKGTFRIPSEFRVHGSPTPKSVIACPGMYRLDGRPRCSGPVSRKRVPVLRLRVGQDTNPDPHQAKARYVIE